MDIGKISEVCQGKALCLLLGSKQVTVSSFTAILFQRDRNKTIRHIWCPCLPGLPPERPVKAVQGHMVSSEVYRVYHGIFKRLVQDSLIGVHMPQENDLKVWWIPQVPMKPFEVSVKTIEEGKLIMDTLAYYDLFQYENRIKPDYCNAGGLLIFEDGEWSDWYHPETGDGIDEYFQNEADNRALGEP